MLWKLIKRNLTKMQLGGWNGELSCSTIWCQLQKELSITDPNRRIINRKESLITDLSSLYRKKNVHCISHKKLSIQQLTMRNHHHPELSFFSNAFHSFKTTPPNFHLLLYKTVSLSFVCWTCLYFFVVICSPRILCYSQINPFLLVK